MKSIFDEKKFEITVEEIMTKKVFTVKTNTSAEICAKLMIENKIGSVVVVNTDGKTIGIITKENLIKHVLSLNKRADKVTAEEVMTTPLITVPPSLTIIQAMQTMFKKGIRHLVILGNKGKILGICTDTDVLKVVPQLILLEQEYLRVMGEEVEPIETEADDIAGYCDDCQEYSENLVYSKGLYLCEDCAPKELIEDNA